MDKILQMLQLQQQLNDASFTNGKGWEKGVTKNDTLLERQIRNIFQISGPLETLY